MLGGLFLLGFTAVGCGGGTVPGGMAGSGGTGNTGGDTGDTGGSSGVTIYRPCASDQRIGGFSAEMVVMEGNSPYSAFTGAVRNGVDPRDVWSGASNATGCALVTGPSLSCLPACGTPMICAGQNRCIAEPASQDAGTVTITGFGSAKLDVAPIVSPPRISYYKSLTNPYPPFSPGAAISLTAAGAAFPAFSLEGRGIEPLMFPGTGIVIAPGQPLLLTWSAPAQPGAARIFIRVNIAFHGGIAARIDCNVDDTGVAQIPADLISMLIDRGTAGFPSVTLIRRTVDSKTIGPGCVDFTVASPVERIVMVEGVTSCNLDTDCPTGQTCKPNLKCS